MGRNIDYDQMSDTYRRIKKRRARERRRRKRKEQMMKLLAVIIFAVLIVAGIIFGIVKATKDNTEAGTVEAGTVETGNAETTTQEQGGDAVSTSEHVEKEEPVPVAAQAETAKYPKLEGFVPITVSEIVAPYQALYCVEENALLAGRGATTKIYPASMTKVMTLIVATEHLKDMDETFLMTSEIIDRLVREEASRAGFEAGEPVRVEDLFYGLALPSGADAATALAILTAGSEEAFVDLMNQKVKELGLKNTHFTNPTGLHDNNQYSTPLEIAMIMAYAMEKEQCAKVMSTYEYVTKPNEFHPEGILLTSTMFSRMYGDEVEGVTILAGKTGFTTEAGNCLVSYAVKGEKHYVAVSAGADGRWKVIFDAFELYGRYIK